MLDSPVSGGPSGAASGKMAIWVGGDEQIFNRHKPVLDAMGDQAAYIGPIGAGSIAKLVHNCTSAVLGVALAEVFTMGVKAGVDPVTSTNTNAPTIMIAEKGEATIMGAARQRMATWRRRAELSRRISTAHKERNLG